MAPNHPDPAERAGGRQLFRQMIELASMVGAPGITMLPGIDWPGESHDESLTRAAAELQARAQEAGDLGLGFSIEAHVGSVCHSPADVLRLCELAPSLRLTVDYTHFVSQGFVESDIEPLAAFARHVQTRGVAIDRLQAPLKDNTLDFERMVDVLRGCGYDGFITIEYIWVDWMRLNEVDVLSETVMLRDRLNAKFRSETWTRPGPTGISENVSRGSQWRVEHSVVSEQRDVPLEVLLVEIQPVTHEKIANLLRREKVFVHLLSLALPVVSHYVVAARIACHTRSGVSGRSRWSTPNSRSASSTALCSAGVAMTVPDSPTPFTPRGFNGDGVSIS
jgi:hypothetical protein